MMPRMDKFPRVFRLFLLLALCAAAPAARAACHALAVGLDRYNTSYIPQSRWLSCCCADAAGFRQALIDGGAGWTETSVTLLTNSAATKTAIRKALTNLAGKAVSGDTVVYYHSSHGGNGDLSRPDVYLCAYNANYTDAELADDLARFASGVKLVIVVDACHSGGLFTDDASSQSATAARASVRSPREAAERTAAWDLSGRVTGKMKAARARAASARAAASAIDPDAIAWLTAAAYYQYSYEASAVGHGYFTYYLLRAFECGDADGDGTLDFREMFDFAACRVPYCDQTPQSAGGSALVAATAATAGVSPLPDGDAWDYADGRPNLSPSPLDLSGSEQTHGPHTLCDLLDESDVFSFSVSALRPVRFRSTGGTALHAELYDSQFRLVRWEEESGQPGDFDLVCKPPADGTMYLKVFSGTTNDAYTLHFRRAPGDDTFPTLHPPCTNAIASLEEGDAAAWRLVVPAGCTSLVFGLTGPSASGDADLYVGEGFIATSSDETDWYGEETGNKETVRISDPAPGEWFVLVSAYIDTKNLSLSVAAEPVPADTAVPVVLADMTFEGTAATVEVLYPDLIPPPATLPVYAATDLVSPVWTFKTNAPLSGGLLALPLPSAPVEYHAIGRPASP